MKIKVWSDLHLEFRNNLYDHIWTPSEDDKDVVLLLAGDIAKGTASRDFMEALCSSFKHVLRICGNHEFYENDFNQVIEGWKKYEEEEAPSNFHFLHNDWRILDGVRFLGGTMWTSFNDGDVIDMAAAHRIMNDYVEIRCDGKRITPQFVLQEHDKFMQFLLTEFDKPFDGPTVVMTHHSPGNALKRLGHRGDRTNSAYFADIEELIGYHNKSVLHVHGHTHRSYDYMINNTRVVCNPYGYWGKSVNRDFNPNLIIEV